jgi:ABC-type sugar transport system substrate-binding protein
MKKLRFLVSLITKDNDYQLEQAAAARTTAQQVGVDAEIIFADNDAINQSTQVLKAIQADASLRPDAIVIEPAGGTAFPQAAKAAGNAGIGWVVVNREADYITELRRTIQSPLFSVSPDQKEVGRIQGRQFATILPRGGSVLYIEGPSESSAARHRTAGLQETIPRNIQLTTLKGRWTEESAYKSVASWLRLMTSQKVRLDLIAAQNDVMAIGARKAVEELINEIDREQWMRIPFIGVDGVPKTGQAWVRTGLLTATVIVPPTTGQAITLMVQGLQNKSRLPAHTFVAPQAFPPVETLATVAR